MCMIDSKDHPDQKISSSPATVDQFTKYLQYLKILYKVLYIKIS